MSDNHINERTDCIEVSETASLGECENTPVVDDRVIYPGGETPIVKVPVVLGEFDVTTNLSANIHFNDPVQEIKKVKHTVEIVQCRLMTNAVSSDPYASGEFPLFLKGFVRKNIQYETPVPGTDRDCVNSDVKSKTIRVPFTCTTMVNVENVVRPLTSDNEEFSFFRAQDLGTGFPEKDKYLSSDLSQFHFMESQSYNEFPFCELISSDVIAWDEATDRRTTGDSPVKEGYFHNVVEKMMIRFRIKVLQKQQVRVNSL